MAHGGGDDLPKAIEKPSSRGVVYSCPWPFELPSSVQYSLTVVGNPIQRQSASSVDFSGHRVPGPCSFPVFQPNSVWLTWLGHASCLFTFCGSTQADSVRVLCDPNFSDCVSGRTKVTGSRRRIPSACEVKDLPEIHALCISHNHFDHMDASTLEQLAARMPGVRCFVPAGDGKLMHGFGFRKVVEMKWWEADCDSGKDLSVTFTPASHWSGRGAFDRNCSLWGSFVLQHGGHRVFFAGDTGYQDRIFKHIGRQFGPFSLSAIPIGRYEPRDVFCVQHVCPQEAVLIHREIRSKLSVGIHWGAFRLGAREGLLQPPLDLRAAMEAARQIHSPSPGNPSFGEFLAVKVGESVCHSA